MTHHDDLSISGAVVLWRRIPPWLDRVSWDPMTGEPTPSSFNFRDPIHELSVYVAHEAALDDVRVGHTGFGVVEITAGEVRGIAPHVLICRDPKPHPAHVLICGRITRRQAQQMVKAAQWVVKPARPPLP